MQLYETSRPQPPFRHGQPPAGSATPIYDSLYAEFHRMFRALPGDRTGEEDLRFVGFGLFEGLGETVGGSGGWRGYARRLDVSPGYGDPLGHAVPLSGSAPAVHRGNAGHAPPAPLDLLSQLGGTTLGHVVPAALPPARGEPQ